MPKKMSYMEEAPRLIAEINTRFVNGGATHAFAMFMNRVMARVNAGKPLSQDDQLMLRVLHETARPHESDTTTV